MKFQVIIISLMILLVACAPPEIEKPDDQVEEDPEFLILAVGDSLTIGRGVSIEDAYPAQLERKLQGDGYDYKIINTGISGETSSGALSRVDWILTLEPDIIILEIGANDGFRAIDPELTKNNIGKIIKSFKEQDVVVIFAGLQIVQNLGKNYTESFANIYPALAEEHDLIFIPFFLEGVATNTSLNQEDGIHPTKDGYTIIVEEIYPYIIEGIEKFEADK